jgi:hypothetical protein
MRTTTIFALACLTASQAAFAQVYTTPVGYHTQSLTTGYNLIGIALQEPIVTSGVLTGVGSGTVTNSAATFSSSLPAGTYILEITSGAQSGAIQVFSSYTNTTITTPDDMAQEGVLAGDSYKIRPVSTISKIFGANNEAGLLASDTAAAADIIWVPTGGGAYDQYYRNSGLVIGQTVIVPPSWQTIGGASAGNTPLIYTDGMFIQRKGGNLNLVISGEVKTTSTRVVLPTGFTIVGSGFPAGSTLDNSGLQNHLTKSDSATLADIVWVPTGPGTYNQYYYNQGLVIGQTVIVPPSWQTLGGAAAGSTLIPPAVFIQRKALTTDAVITTPY